MIRKRIARELTERYGIPMAMVARQTGVTTAAISKIMVSSQVDCFINVACSESFDV